MRLLLGMLALGAGATLVQTPTSEAAESPALTTEQVRAIGKRSLCSGSKLAQDQRTESQAPAPAARPVLLAGFGKGGFPVRTASAQAQAFFDNGMQLAHAFSHEEAVAAFQESARQDESCAMCLWGEAYAAGPTINFPVSEADAARLATLAARARTFARGAPARERALIDAMALRYRDGGGGGRGDLAFARALDALAQAEPGDSALATLAADAWMIYGIHADQPQHFARAKALLEGVLGRDPDYAPAIHYYIHVTEFVGEAGLAERYADRLQTLAPAASHLVHMPSHTYFRVGRYKAAGDVNLAAVEIGEADARRLGAANGAWDLGYHGHNVHFGIIGAMVSGERATALAIGRRMLEVAGGAEVPHPWRQMVIGSALAAEGVYGEAEALLAMPAPPEGWTYTAAYWRYARGEAAARTGNAAAVRAEFEAMPEVTDRPDMSGTERAAVRMAQIGRLVLEGRAATLENRPLVALAAFWRAAQLQERPSFAQYADPPLFWYPVRRDVALTLHNLRLHRAAVQEADATLRDWPNEPMTLATRAAARQALGERAGAQGDRARAWAGWGGHPFMLLR